MQINQIGMLSPELLRLVETCPAGAEALVMKVVHLLTERSWWCDFVSHVLNKCSESGWLGISLVICCFVIIIIVCVIIIRFEPGEQEAI